MLTDVPNSGPGRRADAVRGRGGDVGLRRRSRGGWRPPCVVPKCARPQLRAGRGDARHHGRAGRRWSRRVVQGVHRVGPEWQRLLAHGSRHRAPRDPTRPRPRHRRLLRTQGVAAPTVRPEPQQSRRSRRGREAVSRHVVRRVPLCVRARDLRRALRPGARDPRYERPGRGARSSWNSSQRERVV